MKLILRCDVELGGERLATGTEIEVGEDDAVRMLRKRMATEVARKPPAKKKAKKDAAE